MKRKRLYPIFKSRQLTKQYLKAKSYIEDGCFELVDFRKRQPKNLNKFYFKINEKYRAFGYINDNRELIVTEVSDHQDG